MDQQIILASGSKARKMIMDSLGVPYIVIPANIDEKAIRDDDLIVRAQKIARAKAENVSQNHEGIIIAADTFVAVAGRILEKPQSLEEAKRMLTIQSNHSGTLYTGFCYIDKTNNINYSTTSMVRYTLRVLPDEEIDNFVANNPVMDWAGAFSPLDIYQLGFFSKIDGSPTGLNGLPVGLLVPCLQKSGVQIKSTS